MTQDEIIEMAREAGFEITGAGWIDVGPIYMPLENLIKLAATKERELILDEYWMCVNSDLENGVKSLNEKAAERFKKYFPELFKFGSWLEARGEQA